MKPKINHPDGDHRRGRVCPLNWVPDQITKGKRALVAFVALTLLTPNSAYGMGSGDKYQDLQTGVTYVVYKPTNTLKLPPLNFEVRPCRLYPKKDVYLLAGFGGMEQGIALVETSAQYNCTGVDTPQPLGTVKINGITAKLGIYCATKCAASTFFQHGGEITFVTPKSKTLGSTYIRLGTQGGFTVDQLIAFAKGLKPVGSKA